MLLHWSTLEPHGSSSVASIRFSGPVRIRTIRICPKGTILFAQNPQVISETEPDAFALSVFLNAQPAPNAQEPKPKGTNVLIPSTLAYAGGLRDFPLDMGPDFVTRLMVVQGDFTRLTIAVYGDTVSEPPTVPVSYISTPLPSISRPRLSPPLDPSNATDPSLLSHDLFGLIPDPPSLSFAIRLMYCLKATDEEWESSHFTLAGLEECLEIDMSGLDWLEKAFDTLMTPVPDNIDVNVVKKFAEKIQDALSDKTNDHLYVLAGLLRYLSAQHTSVAQTIMDSLDLSDIFESNLIDQHILDRLHDAAANPIIARALRIPQVLETFQSIRDAKSSGRPLQHVASGLVQRVLGWDRFEKALCAPVPDLVAVTRWIKEIASDEMTFGVFLLSMIEDESLVSKLHRHAVQEQPTPPPALWNSTGLASSTEFISFVRAFVGVSCVVTVLCWADSIVNDTCAERVFAILRLWQEVDGYREIVHHLLLIPQLTYRLESVLKNGSSSPPNILALHVEQIVATLFTDAESITRPELAGLVNVLPSFLSFISEEERSEMVEIALIAENGLQGAVKTLLNWADRPVDTTGARALFVALLILEKALEDREMGELKVMQTAWQDESHGLVYRVVELLQQLVAPIHGQFLLMPPPPLQPRTLAQLLLSSNAAMRILSRLLPVHPVPSRLNYSLTRSITTLFIATDAVDSRYTQGSAIRQAAQVVRPTCAEALSVLSSMPYETEPSRVGGELVLRTLLHIALYPEGDDPVARLEQVFWLLDLVLPLSLSDSSGDRTEQRFWTRKVIPNVSLELQRFLRALAVDLQVQLVKRLTELDCDEVGLGQWFVDEEVKHLWIAIRGLTSPQSESDSYWQSISQVRVTNSLQFLSSLIEAHLTGTALEFFKGPITLQYISRIFNALSELPTTIAGVRDFACLLAPQATFLEPQVQLDLALALIRCAGSHPPALVQAGTVLSLVDHAQVVEATRIAGALGPALQRLVEEELHWQQEKEELAQAVVSCLSWLVRRPQPETVLLPGLTEASYPELLNRVTAVARENEKLVSDLHAKFVFSDDVVMRHVPDESGTLSISTDQLVQLLTPRPTTPSTPRLSGESIFKMATLSPITAIVGSSRISTLTKTYQNNDFRQLSVRQNTSRRPSMHVDVGV